MKARIEYLDGLRGVAILLVLGYHAYARWGEIVPYGNMWANMPIFRFGNLGVQLFFIISGFVILMSLEQSSPLKFLIKRWLRLFPAMLICSLFIYFSTDFFSDRPGGEPQLLDFFVGISLLEPDLWSLVFEQPTYSLEGSFWSLYVEVKFYVVAALLFRWVSKENLVHILFACFLTWAVLEWIQNNDIGGFTAYYLVADALSFEYFGWFASGAAFYLGVKYSHKGWFTTGIFYGVVCALHLHNLWILGTAAALSIVLLFALSLHIGFIQQLLTLRFFTFFGFISYPLYLLHENMMISTIIALGRLESSMISLLYPILALIPIIMLAYLVTKFGEPRLKSALQRYFMK